MVHNKDEDQDGDGLSFFGQDERESGHNSHMIRSRKKACEIYNRWSDANFMRTVLLVSICGLFVLMAAAQELRPRFPDDPRGLKLPAALPRMVDTNGNVVWIDEHYTTRAWYDLASQYILQEMNDAAKELQLPDETLPLSAANAA